MRIDRRGNIWVIGSFMNIIMKLNAKGEPIAIHGVRDENAPWDDTKWNGMCWFVVGELTSQRSFSSGERVVKHSTNTPRQRHAPECVCRGNPD